MLRKFVSLTAGFSLLALGVMPALASQDATTDVDILNNVTLAIANAAPFGSGANTYQLTPTSGSVSTKIRAGSNAALPSSGTTVTTTLTLTTNSVDGGTISANGATSVGGNDVAGELYSVTNDENLNNAVNGGDAPLLNGTCESVEDDDDFEGIAMRVTATGTDADYVYDNSTTIAVKYGAETDATTRLYCSPDGTARNVAITENFDDPTNGGRDLVIDWIIALKAGTVTAGTDYTETITFTPSAN